MAEIHPETELIPYLRGELSADERARIGAHLEGCAQCRASVDASSAILTSLARVVDEVRDPDWTAYRAELTRKLRARQATAASASGRHHSAVWWALSSTAPRKPPSSSHTLCGGSGVG